MSRVSAASYLSASFIAAIAATTIGCAAHDATDAGPVDFVSDSGGEATGGAAEARVVVQLTTDEGATLTFMNENAPTDDPVISVEISSPASTPVVDALLAQHPSALEIYLALKPGKVAPDELVREHRLLAASDPTVPVEPRVLGAATLTDSHLVERFTCEDNYWGWLAAFTSWAPPLDGQYTAANVGISNGYVGYAPKFYFDVCRTTSSSYAYVVRTERRTNSSALWSTYNDGSPLGFNQRYRFYRNSFTCSSYQYRLHVNPVGGGGYYRGATWADEWSCQISG